MKIKYNSTHLSYEEQLKKFIDRGMEVKDKEFCLTKLASINYYKLKEFSIPYCKNGSYQNISLERVIKRFYKDKDIRLALLSAIEKVEISFKNKIAYILGEKFGAFGYLDFKNWIDKSEYCKHYAKLREKQFKDSLKLKTNRAFNPFIKEFFNLYDEEFLPIWLTIEVMTFGDALEIYSLMTKSDKIKIAKFYQCNTSELKSWLEHLKLIRNMSAHNSGIIDIKLRTIPIIRQDWKINLFQYNGNYTDRIANTLVILKHLLNIINPKFHFGDVAKAFQRLTKGNNYYANMYGLLDANLSFLFK